MDGLSDDERREIKERCAREAGISVDELKAEIVRTCPRLRSLLREGFTFEQAAWRNPGNRK